VNVLPTERAVFVAVPAATLRLVLYSAIRPNLVTDHRTMPVLLFCGDNSIEIDEAVRLLRDRFERSDVLTFDGKDVTLPNLTEACLTAGLFAPERLVIVHDLHERLKGTRSEGGEIAGIIEAVPPTTTLLLLSKEMPADHQLAKLVREAGGKVQPYTSPRKQDLPRWLMARARQRGTTLDPQAAELVADLVGVNSQLLESELEKLATYAGDEGSITPSMVETLVGAVPQDSIFTLVDAIAAGQRAQALRLLHLQLDHASSTPTDFALYLIRMLARQVRILLRIRLARDAGRSSSQITADLKLPRYYADRYFRQAGRLSRKRLITAFEQLASLEQALKTGRTEPGAGLDLLVAELCS
jgi:DNA polymerase-3 subunit delta